MIHTGQVSEHGAAAPGLGDVASPRGSVGSEASTTWGGRGRGALGSKGRRPHDQGRAQESRKLVSILVWEGGGENCHPGLAAAPAWRGRRGSSAAEGVPGKRAASGTGRAEAPWSHHPLVPLEACDVLEQPRQSSAHGSTRHFSSLSLEAAHPRSQCHGAMLPPEASGHVALCPQSLPRQRVTPPMSASSLLSQTSLFSSYKDTCH